MMCVIYLHLQFVCCHYAYASLFFFFLCLFFFFFVFILLCFFFFFKQKTAYEIYQCDWSSDVCSSDLLIIKNWTKQTHQLILLTVFLIRVILIQKLLAFFLRYIILSNNLTNNIQIGRASCRERVQISVVAVSLKKKQNIIKINKFQAYF